MPRGRDSEAVGAGLPCCNEDVSVKTKVHPFLMFQGNAEEAMNFYVSLFPGAAVGEIERYGPGQAGVEGSIVRAVFTLGGQTILCSDSAVQHGFTFTPAISFFVDCESQQELLLLFNALSENGKTFMLLGNYGFSRQFAWVSDRYGVSWQLNLGS
jgi:predicted 3-demethylubiquinone-9 3-methyltransferase (glyoxalase superfamily)